MNIREKIYPVPMSVTPHDGAVCLNGGVCAEAGAQFAADTFIHLAEELRLKPDANGNLLLCLDARLENDEGYIIEAKDGTVKVSAKTRVGFAFAAATAEINSLYCLVNC